MLARPDRHAIRRGARSIASHGVSPTLYAPRQIIWQRPQVRGTTNAQPALRIASDGVRCASPTRRVVDDPRTLSDQPVSALSELWLQGRLAAELPVVDTGSGAHAIRTKNSRTCAFDLFARLSA